MLTINNITPYLPQVKYKLVDYFGYELEVPYWTNWVCFDDEGDNIPKLLAFKNEPELDDVDGHWLWSDTGSDDNTYEYLEYIVEFEGSYLESLRKV